MRRIATPNKAVDLFGPGKHGWKNGLPGTAERSTEGQAEFFNAVQEELATLVEGAGAALVPGDNTQVKQAVDWMIAEPSRASILKNGGQAGLVANNTGAFDAARADLGIAGGVVDFGLTSNFRGNYKINSHNITVRGRGGVAEEDLNCLRPYGLDQPTFQVSNGSRFNRKVRAENLAISGDDGAGNQAVAAMRLAGGTVHFSANNLELRDGEVTLDLAPGGGYPVTTSFFSQFNFRNDLNVPGARTIRGVRPADPNYLTAIYFSQGHVNGPSAGYAVEMDGTGGPGITASFTDVYIDVKSGRGVLLKGPTGIVCHNLQLDPSSEGPGPHVVIENDQTGGSSLDPTRFLLGIMRHGGQAMKNGLGQVIDIPAESEFFAYFPSITGEYFSGVRYWCKSGAGRYSKKFPEQLLSDDGPLDLQGLGRSLTTDNGGRRITSSVSEVIVLSTSGVVSSSAGNMLPDDAYIEAVTWRVQTPITGAGSFSLGDAAKPARFGSGLTTLAIGTSGKTIAHCDKSGTDGPIQGVGNNLRVTTNVAATGGSIRVTVWYRSYQAPTS